MTHIENIFVCISAPLLIAALCVGRKHCRFFLFCLIGMGACFNSADVIFLASLVAIVVELPGFSGSSHYYSLMPVYSPQDLTVTLQVRTFPFFCP